MTMTYPVHFDVDAPPALYQRAHIALRLLILAVLSVVGLPLGGLFGLLYLVLPALAAISISKKGSRAYLEEWTGKLQSYLGWLLGLYAYLGLLTDRLPGKLDEPGVRYEIRFDGTPTVKSALWRLLTSLPEAIALGFLACIAAFVWLIGAIAVVVNQKLPGFVYRFQKGVLRWQARLLAYHASLVEQYPPFSFDTGPDPEATSRAILS
jgi:hypothetical protein